MTHTGEIVETLDVHQAGYSGLVHHLANRYPMMKSVALDEMALDIAAHGQREPIWLDIEGHLIDGRNRLEACRLAGVQPQFAIYDGEAIEAFIVSKNEHRRDMNAKERQEIRRARLAEMRGQGMSTRAIAEELEVSQPTIVADNKVIGDLSPCFTSTVRGRDGKTYKSKEAVDARRQLVGAMVDAGSTQRQIAEHIGCSPSLISNDINVLGLTRGKRHPATIAQRWGRVTELASTSLTADAIAADVGITEAGLRAGCKQRGIVIVSDAVMGGTRRLEANRVIAGYVANAAQPTSAIDAIDYDALDVTMLAGWVASLKESRTSLTTLINKLEKRRPKP